MLNNKFTIAVVVIFLGVGSYLYLSRSSGFVESKISQTPPKEQAPLVEKRQDANPVPPRVDHPPISLDPPEQIQPHAETVEPSPQTPSEKLSWKKEQALHQQRIDELEEMRGQVDPSGELYDKLGDEILREVQKMGMTEYHSGGGGSMMFPPRMDEILDLAKNGFNEKQQRQYSNEIAAMQDLAIRRKEIDAARKYNAQNNIEDSLELVELHQRLVAEEFKVPDDCAQFFEELSSVEENLTEPAP